jgi:hypothetical protein
MPDSFESLIAHRDVLCPRCRYNLRGIRSRVCPECGGAVGDWLLQPPLEQWSSLGFRITRTAAGFACAVGVATLFLELPRTYRRGFGLDIAEVAAAGTGSLLISLAWAIYARRIARARPSTQGRIASAMWVVATIFLLVAMAKP